MRQTKILRKALCAWRPRKHWPSVARSTQTEVSGLALLEISVVPVGTQSTSFSSFVTDACREAKRNGIKFQVTPTSTVMEGDLPALMDVARQMHHSAFQAGSQRVITNISIDERRDKDLGMEATVQSVRGELN